jgi:sigma-B regulation protein RsbU (phosphoserine phosphatase)
VNDGNRVTPPVRIDEGAWNSALADLVQRCEDIGPDEVAAAANDSCRALGIELTLYLVDYEQRRLWPLPERGKPTPAALELAGTTGGTAFTTVTTHDGVDEDGGLRLWIPVVDGGQRLGVAEVYARSAPRAREQLRHNAEVLVALLARLITGKLPSDRRGAAGAGRSSAALHRRCHRAS